MLLEFTVGNFLSFKEKKTFSLEAGSITELKDNIVQQAKYKVLRSAVIYGANSSGKSNFIKAFNFMVTTIINSSKIISTDKLNVKPFLLSSATENQPSFFEILFITHEVFGSRRYRYGFEIDNNIIHSEWLYVLNKKSGIEDLYFIRNKDGIGVADIFEEAKGIESKTRDNGLFITLADQFNSETAKGVMNMLSKTVVLSGIEHESGIHATNALYNNVQHKPAIEDFIKKLDLGFSSFMVDDDSSKGFRNQVRTIHNKFSSKGKIVGNVEFEMTEQESSGTNKIFDLAGYIVFALKYGLTLFVDELDAKLHPILTQAIINLFHNPETNKENGQLIFTTHDTNLLGANLFRRDQIWFTEKDQYESTDMYSLLEFKDENGKTVRKDRSFEKDYIMGRYGAIPYVSNFQEI